MRLITLPGGIFGVSSLGIGRFESLIISSFILNRMPILVAPQGFEPRYAAPEAAVLPLNEGAIQDHPAGVSGGFALL
jgi:hypothetical protein